MLLRGLARGVAAGAAGTTALNAVTYLDMAWRGRPASRTPEQTVDRIADLLSVRIAGQGEAEDARRQGYGALTGIAAGLYGGIAVGTLRGLGLRTPFPVTALLTAGVTMAAGTLPMTLLGITDPRTWSRTDWISDLVPHLAYGVLTAGVLHATEERRVRLEARPIG